MRDRLLLIDTNGNKIYLRQGKKFDSVMLYLKSKHDTKNLGKYSEKDNIFYVTRDRELHFHTKTQSYGFNEMFLRGIDPETVIILREKGGKIKYKTSAMDILSYGQYLYFAKDGYEKQIFMPLDLFTITI